MKTLLFTACVLLTLATAPIQSQDANAPVAAAAAALGAGGLRSIQYSGWGSDYIFGQAYDGGSPWPRFNLPGITIGIDYTTNTLRDDRRRAQAENPPLGGGFQPLTGELRQIWALSGGYAWDIAGQTVAPAAVERDMRSAVEGRTTQIWLTPHGFIKAAQAGKAAARVETVRGARKSVITVTTLFFTPRTISVRTLALPACAALMKPCGVSQICVDRPATALRISRSTAAGAAVCPLAPDMMSQA